MDLFGARTLPFLTRGNYHHEMRHILSWSVLAGLVEGQFASIVVARTFDGSALLIAIATATPFAALTFSLFWGFLCVGRPKVRLTSLLCAGVALFAGAAGAIPATDFGAVWFIGQMAAAQILLAGVITVRAAIWKSNYPHEERGRITARLQGVRELAMVSASMAAAALCTADPLSYRYIYPIAAIFGLFGIIALQRLHIRGERSELRRLQNSRPNENVPIDNPQSATRNPQSAASKPTMPLSPVYVLKNIVRILDNDRRFARYIVAQLLVGISNLLTLAVVVKLIAQDLTQGMVWAYWVSTVLIVALPRLVLLGTIGRWGRLFDRVGVVRFRVVNVLCWIVSLVFGLAGTLALVHPHLFGGMFITWAVLLFAGRAVFFGLGISGGKLAWNIGHLHFARHDQAEIYMGIHVSLTGLRGLVAPVVGMWLWGQIGWLLWVVAVAFATASFAAFSRMARQELREGPPKPADI